MMKGLLMKDLKLMMTQFAFFILLPAVGAVFVVPTGEMSMGFGYITAISGLIGVTTVNYDSYDNGFAYLFTLPVSRRGYVKEKYIFAALSSVAVMMAVGVFMWALMAAVHPENAYAFTDFLGDMENSYLIALTALAFMLPVFLKFGAEKSRFVLLIIAGIFMGVMIGVSQVEALRDVELGRGNWARVITPILCLGWLSASYLISVRIMEKKDF